MSRQVDVFDSSANQSFSVLLDDGSFVQFTLVFRTLIQRWSLDILWGTFALNGIEVCAHPNLLREFRNTLPWGLTVITTDGLDPIFIDDWTSGRATMYVLNQSEVADIETNVFTPAPLAANA